MPASSGSRWPLRVASAYTSPVINASCAARTSGAAARARNNAVAGRRIDTGCLVPPLRRARGGEDDAVAHQLHGRGHFAIQRAVALQERDALADGDMRGSHGAARAALVRRRPLGTKRLELRQ